MVGWFGGGIVCFRFSFARSSLYGCFWLSIVVIPTELGVVWRLHGRRRSLHWAWYGQDALGAGRVGRLWVYELWD